MFWGNFSNKQAETSNLSQHPGAIEMDKGNMYWFACCDILRSKYGFVDSTNQVSPVDADGSPIPLFTYPTIEYLEQLDFSNKTIFEYGAGNSTFFWMSKAKHIVSVDNSKSWYERLKSDLDKNVELILAQGDDFPWVIERYPDTFDVVIIDGAGYRYDCATAGLKKVSETGMIILDNSDWHPNTAECIRKAGLIQIDMSGFKPGECHTSTTSIFLKRGFNFEPRNLTQPSFSRGAKQIHSEPWDKPYAIKR